MSAWPETLTVMLMVVVVLAGLTSIAQAFGRVRVRVRWGTSPIRPWWWSVYLRRAVRSPWERRIATEFEEIPSSGKRWRVPERSGSVKVER